MGRVFLAWTALGVTLGAGMPALRARGEAGSIVG